MDNPRSAWLLPSLVLVVADPPYHITHPDLFVLVTAPGVPQSLLRIGPAERQLDDGRPGQRKERRWGSYAPVTG
ncbi:hypothetical protein C8T65DRAFT_645889 [Cerioporus squamosus]|nr:hypothetical protein C8T65DRAFT_645889 [Cerioporus squamosus]